MKVVPKILYNSPLAGALLNEMMCCEILVNCGSAKLLQLVWSVHLLPSGVRMVDTTSSPKAASFRAAKWNSYVTPRSENKEVAAIVIDVNGSI